MKNTILRYGTYGVLVLISINMIVWFGWEGSQQPENYSIGEVIGYMTIVLSLVFVYFGVRHFRDHVQGGHIDFWKAFRVGLLITLLPALAFGIYNYIFMEWLSPEFAESYYMTMLEQSRNQLSTAEYEQRLQDWEKNKEFWTNGWLQSGLMFFTVFIIGMIVSLLSALFLMKRETQQLNQAV